MSSCIISICYLLKKVFKYLSNTFYHAYFYWWQRILDVRFPFVKIYLTVRLLEAQQAIKCSASDSRTVNICLAAIDEHSWDVGQFLLENCLTVWLSEAEQNINSTSDSRTGNICSAVIGRTFIGFFGRTSCWIDVGINVTLELFNYYALKW